MAKIAHAAAAPGEQCAESTLALEERAVPEIVAVSARRSKA
jgi:hypothetical protein